MEFKDIATIAVSVLALFLSAFAFAVTYLRGQDEQRRAIRQQLTEATDKITETYIEYTKLILGEAKDNVPLKGELEGIVGQRITSLLDQAVYLASLAPSLVTSVDYNTIAIFGWNTGNVILAETNYVKAIKACPNDFSRAGYMRSFGQFLFAQRRFEEGRQAFRDAAALLKGADTMVRMQKGSIYLAWGQCEQTHAASPRQAADAFENASSEFMGIDNEEVRKNALLRLDLAKGLPPPAPQILPRAEARAA